jgi:ubiquinone/menaquinone biosynthesis C-methylase UbiE
MAAPSSRPYASLELWEDRYTHSHDARSDWLVSFEALRPTLLKLLRPDSEIVDLGCGTSDLLDSLSDEGFLHLTGVDFSSALVTAERDRHATLRSHVEFICADCTELPLPSACADACIDKGLLDTVLTGETSFVRAALCVREAHRILRPGGVFLVVSHSPPDHRLPIIAAQSLAWRSIDHAILPRPGMPPVHLYVCRR